MRPLRQDVTGTTDTSGNATIRIVLPSTGEWHELKVSLSTTGPAEWAILVSGTAITYGRGRRVTLGPELIQDGEIVTIAVTGGPTASAIIGAVTGKSGTPEEILSAYSPQPNTIGLDATAPRQKLYAVGTTPTSAASPSFVVPAGSTTFATFILPAGATELRILPVRVPNAPPPISFILSVVGLTTGVSYFPGTLGSGTMTSPAGTVTVPVDLEWDPSVQIVVNAGSSVQDINVFVTALFAVESVGQGGAATAVTLQNALAAPWQAARNAPAPVNATLASGANSIVVAASGTTIINLLSFNYAYDAVVANAFLALQDTNGNNYHIEAVLTTAPHAIFLGGAPLPAALGVRVANIGAAGPFTIRGSLVYSQT